MNHPLDGARLKVVRAQEHLDTLKAEIFMWLNEQPHEIRSQGAPYPNIDNQVLPQLVPNQPPLRLSTIVGDCVTNARAALDYTIWQLALRHFDPPLVDSDRKWVSWPIYATITTERYVSKTNGFAKHGIPTDAIREIHRTHHQNAGYESLWWLNELVNSDKHRIPLMTVCEFDHVEVTLVTPLIYRDLIKEPATIVVPRDREAHTVTMQSNVQMQAKYPLYVALEDVSMPREPVDRTLQQIIETVANVIPRFDRFF